MTTITTASSRAKRTRAVTPWAAEIPPRPIRTRTEHRAAMDELMRLGRLIDARKAIRAQADAAGVLELLVTDYEERQFREGIAIDGGGTPVERLRYLVNPGYFL
jgi:hypothetical protein